MSPPKRKRKGPLSEEAISMIKWTEADWGTKSGKNSIVGKMLQAKDTYLKLSLLVLLIKNMLQQLKRNVKALRKRNNMLKILKQLQ